MAQNGGPEQEREHTLFVYGSLKRGFPNHYFLRDSYFVSLAKTVERYSLYVDVYPFVYPRDSVSPIHGEVYKVDDNTLYRLDALEGHPHLSRREQIEVRLKSGERMRAWIYFFPERSGRLISSGEFKTTTGLGKA